MASQAGRVAAPPADPRLVMPANVSAWAQSGFQAYVRGAKPPWLRRGLRITRVFPCVARGLRTCASFMFASCRWRRSLAVDGRSGAFQGHALVVRRPGSPVDRRALRTTVRFQAGHIPCWRESCERHAQSPVAAVCRWPLRLLSPLLSAACAVCLSLPAACAEHGPRTFLLWLGSLRAAPLPHRTDCCRLIRRRGGVKGRFACTLTRHFPLCSLPCGHIGP